MFHESPGKKEEAAVGLTRAISAHVKVYFAVAQGLVKLNLDDRSHREGQTALGEGKIRPVHFEREGQAGLGTHYARKGAQNERARARDAHA